MKRRPRLNQGTIRRATFRRPISLANQLLLRDLLSEQGMRCAYCLHRLKSRDATIDHVIPRSRGGSCLRGNLVAACWACNNRKGDATWEPRL